MTKIKVSVIVAVYNQAEYLGRCLASLSEQSLAGYELIVVNDGSADQTAQVLADFEASVPVGKLSQAHQGPAVARNLGAEKARGEVLVFVDADMDFDREFLKVLTEPIFNGQAKGTYTLAERVANWKNVWARCWNYNWGLPDKKRVDPQRQDQQRDFRAILKKEFDRVKGFDKLGYTDTWSLSAKLGYRPSATKAVCFHYNPASLKKVFVQAKWAAKRPYKLGWLGRLVALARASVLGSLINGLRISIREREPAFMVFKLVYDAGFSLGILERKVCA